MNWWHYSITPSGPYLHQLDPTAVAAYVQREMAADAELTEDTAMAEAHGMAVEEIRTALGFPKLGRWMQRPGWDSSLSAGDPHPNLLKACRAAGHEPGAWPLEP